MNRALSIGDNKCSIEGCTASYYGNSFCKKHHQWHWKRGLLPAPVLMTAAEKIRAFSVLDPVTGCWNWTRGKNNKGYGTISLGEGRKAYAHRVSYETFIGHLCCLEACHRCDNPACVNPGHLFAGSHQDNMRDCMVKARNKRDEISGRYLGHQG